MQHLDIIVVVSRSFSRGSGCGGYIARWDKVSTGFRYAIQVRP
jgi:hypothetical protein